MSPKPKFQTVDEYFDSIDPEVRPLMDKLRNLVRSRAPDAEELLSYGVPAFKKVKVFFFYAAFRKHIGIYPPVEGEDSLMKELAPYRGAKGNLQLPLNQPMPWNLIGRIVDAQIAKYGT
jgi:uncharacterized protein YdhG (YjbR/CyaY superfamily)